MGAAVSIDKIVFPTEIGNTLNSNLKLQRNYDIQNDSLLVLEDLVSGTAISKIYELKTNKKLSSERVYEKFKENDEIAIKVINGFIKSLAETLSDLALTFLPGEGIFLAGSLIRNLYKDIKWVIYSLYVRKQKIFLYYRIKNVFIAEKFLHPQGNEENTN